MTATATERTAIDVDRAVDDIEYYTATDATLTGPQAEEFRRAVDAAYDARYSRTKAQDLTPLDAQVLAFERRTFRTAVVKEVAIRATFDFSATRYYQLLNALLDNEAALKAEPALIIRLRRARQVRRARRSAREQVEA